MTRIAGWDTHGLPVEIEVEKELGLDGKKAIEAFGVAEFNARARESVFKYQSEWQELSNRIGYWLDYDHPYVTCTNDYVESVWWLLKRLHEKELLDRGHRVLPYCPRCGTVLSSHELALGYEDVRDRSVYVTFPLADGSGRELVVWTTTPWTLPSNVAAAVQPDLEYGEYGSATASWSWRPPAPGSRGAGREAPSSATSAPGARSRDANSSGSATAPARGRRAAGGQALAHRRRRATSSPRRTAPASCTWRRRSAPTTTRRAAARPRDGPAGRGGRHVRRHELAGDRGAARHRRRDERPHHPPAQARRPLAPHRGVRPQLPALLALQQHADLLRRATPGSCARPPSRSGCSS